MSTVNQLVDQYLPQLNLNFNFSINPMVISFLKHDVGVINDIQPQYQIYGAAAIISETQQLKTLQQNCTSRNGITIQNVMSHLGSLSKESFLNTLNTQIQRLKNLPQSAKTLKKRVQDIRYSYRFFKKYQQSFQALYSTLLPRKQSTKDDFCALFWLVFLYIKNQHIQTQNITQSKHLLIILLGLVFKDYLCKADKTYIHSLLSKHIGNLPQPKDKKQSQEQEQKQSYYKKKIEEKLDSFYSQRFSSQKTDFQKLMDNFTFVERLVDDMSNAYKKEEQMLKYYNQVDQLSYLELKKNLTPQVFRKAQIELSIEPIKTALLFDDEDEEQSDNCQSIVDESQSDNQFTVGYTVKKQPHIEEPVTPPSTLQEYTPLNSNTTSPITTPKWFPVANLEPMCPITLFDSNFNATPISKKCQNQQYLRQQILKCFEQHITSFDKLISSIQANKMQQQKHPKEHPHQHTSPLTLKITQLIKDFTPKCQHPTQRTHEMLSFIISNLNELIPQSLQKTSSGDLIYGIICLSCELFNYVNNSISCQYKHHCQVFGVGCSVAYQALEMFSSKLSGAMPLDLQEYLRKLKKRFFVCDVWEGENGYDIIRNHGNNPQLKSIYEAILAFSTARIKQICQPCSIEPKIVAKTTNMIHYLFDHKPNLFQYNNLDQLILCCLMSCLSINEKHQHKTLEHLFYEYSANIQFAFNSNQQGLKDSHGKEMKIVEYYNDVFLEEIKDMLTVKFQQIDDFLLTPVRISNTLTLNNMGKRFSSLKQDPMKKEHKGGLFMFNAERMKDKKTTYLQNLVKQNQAMMNQEMKEQKDEEDNDDIHSSKEDLPSPSFGMPRLYSFRKPSQQK